MNHIFIYCIEDNSILSEIRYQLFEPQKIIPEEQIECKCKGK